MPMLKSAAANVLVRLSRQADAERNYALADRYDFIREALRLADASPTHISDESFNKLWHTDQVKPRTDQDLSAPNSVPRDQDGKPLPGLKTPQGFLAQSDMHKHVQQEMAEMNKRMRAKPSAAPTGNAAAPPPQAPELTETQLKQIRFRPSPSQAPAPAMASRKR